ncbi:hypothetical protein HDU67_006256 [Dinochytrium kinnereticum]|nr:hypothetical protein HDU67_006256 [Dinochytrium kinnereticum]
MAQPNEFPLVKSYAVGNIWEYKYNLGYLPAMINPTASFVAAAILSLAAMPHHAEAQFVLTFPLARGYDVSRATVSPCGGFNNFVKPVAFPIC